MTLLAIAAGTLLLAGAIAVSHSRFTADLGVIDDAWTDVEADFRRRHDLIPRLIETVRGAASDLGPLLDEVVVARTRAIQLARQAPRRVLLRAQAENDLTAALRQVLVRAADDERVTDSHGAGQAVAALDDLHRRIAADAHLYNLAVQGHNRRVGALPSRVVAGIFGIERRPYLTAVDGTPPEPIDTG